MDEREILILIRDKITNEYKDKTREINAIYDANRCYTIYFVGGNGYYTYNKRDVLVLPRDAVINIENKDIYYKNEQILGGTELISFGTYAKLFIGSRGRLLFSKYIRLIRRLDFNNEPLFQYLNEIIDIIRPAADSEDAIEISLKKGIAGFNKLSKESFLYYLLTERVGFNDEMPKMAIYPFKANQSQREAVRKALTNRVSIIEGPPGTGKTQTILNIIANLIIRDKSVAVVSGKNEAILNIYEKLDKQGYAYLCATLGSRKKKDEFFSKRQYTVDEIVDSLEVYKRVPNAEEKIKKYQQCEREDLKKAKLLQELEDLFVEYQAFKRSFNNEHTEIPKAILNCNPGDELYIIHTIAECLEKKKGRLFLLLRLHKWIGKKYFKDIDKWNQPLMNKYYLNRIEGYNDKIEAINKRLKSLGYKELASEIDKMYNDYFKGYLFKKYLHMGKASFSNNDDEKGSINYFYNFEKFIDRYPVVTSTTFSLPFSRGRDYVYDYLIMDESSQADIVSTLIAFSLARNVVVIGDSKQLDKIMPSEEIEPLNEIFTKYNLNKAFNYTNHNALSMIRELATPQHVTLINEHFRCDPYIIGFCNKRFYNNELIIRTQHESTNKIRVIKTNSHQNRDLTNQRQVDEILKLIEEIKADDAIRNQSIGIISPFKNQAELLSSVISKRYPDIRCGTIHKFQGRENDIIIISTVKNEIKSSDDFLEKKDLVNVAISRAKCSIYLLVSDKIYENTNTLVNDFVEYEKLINMDISVVEGSVNSIFDMMYSDYNGSMRDYYISMDRIYDEDSENIVANVLNDTLVDDLSHIGYLHNYPLLYLINQRCYSKLTPDEIGFIETGLSHIDFLIYNKVSKSLVVAIEIDGYQHKSSQKQIRRDELKNSILTKLNIPLIRYSTTDAISFDQIRNDIVKYLPL